MKSASNGPWRRQVLAAACLVAAGTLAQQAAGEQQEAIAGRIRVDVTGSNIPRTEAETGLPVQVITREDIERSGIQTMQDLLDRVSANLSFGAVNEAIGEGNTTVGLTAASLRGLGSQRTLILLNGQRLAPYAMEGGRAIDLSAIPMAVIDRVEVLKDGASAVYGTDAIGGVINFILRKDYSGAEASATYAATQHRGGDSGRANVVVGYGNLARDRINAFAALDYYKQDALRAAERDFSKTAYIPDLGLDRTNPFSFPANLRQGSRRIPLVNPTIPLTGADTSSCDPPFSFATARQPGCRFDYASVIDILPDAEKTNAIARVTWQVAPAHQVFAETSWYRGTFTQRISPTPAQHTSDGMGLVMPPSSPFYPAAFMTAIGGNPNAPIEVRWRMLEFGPRADVGRSEQWRAVAGAMGTWRDWDYAVSANYNANRQTDEFVGGYFSDAKITGLMSAGVINPFASNTPQAIAAINAAGITGLAHTNRASNFGADAKVSTTLFRLPTGDLAFAAGVEGHRESLSRSSADFMATGDVIGGPGEVPSQPEAHRRVWAAYGEINVPVVRSFELNLAVRHDQYSDFGGTTNPKATLRWQPYRKLLLRGSWGTGFRAPTLSDLFQPNSFSFSGRLTDPLRCPVTHSEDDCDTSFRSKNGGNPALEPEKSDQWNAGLVLEPAPGLSLSLDYFDVRVRNLIDIIFSNQIFGDYTTYAATQVVRKPVDPAFPNLPGPIDYIIEWPINFGLLTTSGVDASLRWRLPPTTIGQFTLALDGTYVASYRREGVLDIGAFPPGAGTRPRKINGAVPRWRHYATINWTRGPWGATVAQNFQSSFSENCVLDLNGNSADASGCLTRQVGSYSVFDVQARYAGFSNLTLSAGVRNILDTAPPRSNQSWVFQAGFDPTYTDPRGRTFYATLRYAFK